MNELSELEDRIDSTLENLNRSETRRSKRIKNKNEHTRSKDSQQTEDEMLQLAIKNSLKDTTVEQNESNGIASANFDNNDNDNDDESDLDYSYRNRFYNNNNNSNYSHNTNNASIMINNVFKFRTLPISELPIEFYSIFGNNNFSSDKILVPNSIMQTLFDSNSNNTLDIYILKITNRKTNTYKYCTIGDFIPGDVSYLPELLFYSLGLESLDECKFEIVSDCKSANKVVLQPEQYEFLKVKDQQELLLNEFNKNFRILTSDQQIVVNSGELNMDISFVVEKILDENDEEMDIGKIIDVDLVVDFNVKQEFLNKYQSEIQAELEEKRRKEEEERLKKEEEERIKRGQFNPQRMRFSRPNNNNNNGFIVPTDVDPEQILRRKVSFQGEGRQLGGITSNIGLLSGITDIDNLSNSNSNSNTNTESRQLSAKELREIRLKRFTK